MIQDGKVNAPLVEWANIKHEDGVQITVWSSRGAANATLAVMLGIVSHMLSKPGYIVDDKGWAWVKYSCLKQI